MKRLNQLVPRAKNLPASSLRNGGCRNHISIYEKQPPASKKEILAVAVTIKNAFPGLPTGFYEVFTDRIIELGLSADRLRDAVNYVIDTCVYPSPTIAQFVSFDRVVKTYTHAELCDMVAQGHRWDDYKVVRPGRYALKTEIKIYKL